LKTTLHSLKLQPTRVGYRDLGLHYYYDGEYEKAADAYERAVELGPADHWSLGSLANVYTRLESKAHLAKETFARAARLAEAVMERDPGDWTTLAALATYNVFSGEAARGLEQIETAVSKGAHIDEVHYYDAVINSHFERDERALAALERAVALGLPINLVARDPQFTRFDDKSRFQQLILAKSEGG
jgi:tetratricopeptide (TPR) repeat protein